MLSRVRYFFADIGYWIGSRLRSPLGAAVGVLLLAGIVVGVLLATGVIDGNESEAPPPSPAPPVVVHQHAAPEQPQDLGFPTFATKNTTRVAGADPVADAVGVALAVFPSTGGASGPDAVTLVDAEDWAGGVAASVLAAPPVRAPILLTSGGEVPSLTADALTALAPEGSAVTGDAQAFRVGAAAKVKGLRTETVQGKDAAELASDIDRLREKLVGEQPKAIVITSSTDPDYAMPAAAWAARSGDPVLFIQGKAVPKATLEALHRHDGVPVYVLGPESVISAKALGKIEDVSGDVTRVGATGAVENAIAFARYTDGSFGWNINDPGHGFVIASADRPQDAAAASSLSASGTWGPLLLTDSAHSIPAELRGYLLDVKPGYLDNPTRAVYNHIWVIGDPTAISVPFQAQADELAEAAPVRSGTGQSVLPAPGEAPAPGGKQNKSE